MQTVKNLESKNGILWLVSHLSCSYNEMLCRDDVKRVYCKMRNEKMQDCRKEW